jgi:hypothetical protein
VKKKYYQDVTAQTDFSVCYHVEIDLDFDKEPPEYFVGEPVEMTVHMKDEEGLPVNGCVESLMILPDGVVVTDVEWSKVDDGLYIATYVPEQEGLHNITVGVKDDIKCYLEEASGSFHVGCEDAVVTLEIGNAVIDEPVHFLLTVTDEEGNPLTGAEIESELCNPDDSCISLSWTDQKDGTYTAEYTPSLLGWHQLCGTFIIIDDSCYKGFFEGVFTVFESMLPDLLIRDEDIRVEPDPHVGEEVTIYVTVWNIGKGDAGEFYVLVLINSIKLESKLVEGLAAHKSITLAFKWKVMYSGEYVVRAIADAGGEII